MVVDDVVQRFSQIIDLWQRCIITVIMHRQFLNVLKGHEHRHFEQSGDFVGVEHHSRSIRLANLLLLDEQTFEDADKGAILVLLDNQTFEYVVEVDARILITDILRVLRNHPRLNPDPFLYIYYCHACFQRVQYHSNIT